MSRCNYNFGVFLNQYNQEIYNRNIPFKLLTLYLPMQERKQCSNKLLDLFITFYLMMVIGIIKLYIIFCILYIFIKNNIYKKIQLSYFNGENKTIICVSWQTDKHNSVHSTVTLFVKVIYFISLVYIYKFVLLFFFFFY